MNGSTYFFTIHPFKIEAKKVTFLSQIFCFVLFLSEDAGTCL